MTKKKKTNTELENLVNLYERIKVRKSKQHEAMMCRIHKFAQNSRKYIEAYLKLTNER